MQKENKFFFSFSNESTFKGLSQVIRQNIRYFPSIKKYSESIEKYSESIEKYSESIEKYSESNSL